MDDDWGPLTRENMHKTMNTRMYFFYEDSVEVVERFFMSEVHYPVSLAAGIPVAERLVNVFGSEDADTTIVEEFINA